jgi:starch synthase (maltosyl-transferring)
MRIYNLFPLLAGKFNQWEPHLLRAVQMGFNWVFINPVQKPGKSGSLYSIADYFGFNPLLLDPRSTLSEAEQFKGALAAAHGLGMSVLVDLVINHCAYDSPLVTKEPQWFERENGQVQHPYCVEPNGDKNYWYDLAHFDHQKTSDPEGLYRYFTSVIEHLISLGVDGFRCDAAYQIPRRFWTRLITDTRRRHPTIRFVAETLGCTADQTRDTAAAGFDYVFNSAKWWDYHETWLIEQYQLTREIAPSIGFPESHDTARLFTEFGGNEAAIKQRTLFTFLFGSGAMIPMGFEYGFKKPLHVVNSSPADWEETSLDLTDFIRRLNEIKIQYLVFREECPAQLLELDNRRLLGLWKGSTNNREEALLVLNTDVYDRQVFYVDTIRSLIQSQSPLKCVSPDNPLEHINEPFHYELRPGEGLVFVTER